MRPLGRIAPSVVCLEFLPLVSDLAETRGVKPKGGEKIWKMLDFGQKCSRLRRENPHFWRFQTPKNFRAPSARDFFWDPFGTKKTRIITSFQTKKTRDLITLYQGGLDLK